jgi:hypothetical protein
MPISSRVQVALSSGVSASDSGREFMQDRLGVFGFWSGVLSLFFLVLRVVGEALVKPSLDLMDLVLSAGFLSHGAASSTGLLLWLVATRGRALSTVTLRRLDAGATLLISGAFAVMGASLAGSTAALVGDPQVSMLTATLAVAFTVMWRAVAVPSTPGHTALLTSVALAPLVAADVIVLARGLTGAARIGAPLFSSAWAVVTAITATVTSDVVFGLRREVRRAERLGQYTLEQKIGEGAMGVVYRARHAMLRRPTAVKLLPPERAGETALKRFEREVQLTAQLTHPNTVAVYDFGRTPDGVFYYAMELLDGINLEDLVRRFGAQPEGRVIHVLRQVASALAEAHALGLVHRDIKPANVILGIRGGDPDVAKVVDFGLVTRLDTGDASALTTLDTAPVIAGTPLYLAPEAISSPDQVDGRSDLYSLAAVGYLLLTGQPLFEARTLVELCAHHLHTPPTPPSIRLGRAVDAALEEALLRCLSKQPADRPGSALALHELLGDSPAARAWTMDQARAWWRVHGTEISRQPPAPADPDAVTIAVDIAGR